MRIAAVESTMRHFEMHFIARKSFFSARRTSQDSLAEWSKALAKGASPQGRGFEPHSCHLVLPATANKPAHAAAQHKQTHTHTHTHKHTHTPTIKQTNKQTDTKETHTNAPTDRQTQPQPGTSCSGITPAQHAGGPGFNPQCVHITQHAPPKTAKTPATKLATNANQ